MPTIEQIRAARALLDWSQSDLAERADLSQTGIARIENGTNKPNSSTLTKIESAFDKADVEFIAQSGVKKRTNEIRTLNGVEGFQEFMNDVYETARDQGGEISVYNVDEKNWIKWMGEENYKSHSKRMQDLGGHIKSKILVREGDTFFIATDFAEYRWFPENLFNEQSIYAYGKKLALINFTETDTSVMILNNAEFTQGFKVLFDIAWNYMAREPEKNKKKA